MMDSRCSIDFDDLLDCNKSLAASTEEILLSDDDTIVAEQEHIWNEAKSLTGRLSASVVVLQASGAELNEISSSEKDFLRSIDDIQKLLIFTLQDYCKLEILPGSSEFGRRLMRFQSEVLFIRDGCEEGEV
ncbi:unnamed protein product [Ceutorhynchus assimilis]|uniref:Uncharacterized protein n=1 Tax=Ceutorhynchus assimilis TaxID=467358 RepID=A0A9N9QR46_9CUCU|nr:unnamed protein product [Ceutorhynchus assimilis]